MKAVLKQKDDGKAVYLSTLRPGEWFKFEPASSWCRYGGITGGKHVYFKPYADFPTVTAIDHRVIRRHSGDC